jgi:hypothetical protein
VTLIFAAPLKEPTIPSSYLLRTTVVVCQNCGSAKCTSEFLAMSLVRSRNGAGTPVRHYETVTAALWNLPVERVAAPPRPTAFCIDCTTIDLSHLPPPPSAARLNQLPDLVLKGQPRPKTAAQAPRKPNLADLA